MRTHRLGVAAVVLAVTLLAAGLAGGVAAAGNTFRIEPSSTSVAKDASFTIKVVQSAAVATSGAQITLAFDKAIVQITSVTRGAPWASSPLFLAGDAAAISAANKSGKLKTVAGAFFPPGSVKAGDAEFLVIGMKATACGESNLGLPVGVGDAAMLDGQTTTYGQPLKVTATGGKVIVSCSGAPAGSGSPPPEGVTPAPSGSGGVSGETPAADPNASGSPDPNASGSPDPNASTVPGATPSLDPAIVSGQGASSNATPPEQEAWLTFALAALAVAAAGLAALIAILVLAALVAAIVGPFFLIRYYRSGIGSGPPPPEGEGDFAAGEPPADSEPAADGDAATGAAEPEPGVLDEGRTTNGATTYDAGRGEPGQGEPASR